MTGSPMPKPQLSRGDPLSRSGRSAAVDDLLASRVVVRNAMAVADAVNQFMISGTPFYAGRRLTALCTIAIPRQCRLEFRRAGRSGMPLLRGLSAPALM